MALLAALPAALLFVCPARADELKLKDGTKIVGTIVGFEESSFKVKTSYGFAVVQKDQVVSISISDAGKKPDNEKKTEPAADKSPAPAKPAKAEAAKQPATSAPAQPANSSAASIAPSPTPQPTTATTAAPATAKSTPPPAVAAAPPPKPPAPEPMREEVSGNTYTNKTYGFQMYKPPDWELVEGARTMLPGAITALGTSDEKTYLLIGQEPAGKSLATDMDTTEKRLREILDNFRPLGEKHITVAGMPAIEQRFRGSVDKHDWSGIVVFLPRDSHIYTIFGMTYAETDLVQIQENVINRAISSLQFTKQ